MKKKCEHKKTSLLYGFSHDAVLCLECDKILYVIEKESHKTAKYF